MLFKVGAPPMGYIHFFTCNTLCHNVICHGRSATPAAPQQQLSTYYQQCNQHFRPKYRQCRLILLKMNVKLLLYCDLISIFAKNTPW